MCEKCEELQKAFNKLNEEYTCLLYKKYETYIILDKIKELAYDGLFGKDYLEVSEIIPS